MEAGVTHTITRNKGNIDSLPVYAIQGISTPNTGSSISVSVNGTEIKIVDAVLLEGETLMIDTDKMTAWVENENGYNLRSALPYLQEIEFPSLRPGVNTIYVSALNAVFTSLDIRAKSRWR